MLALWTTWTHSTWLPSSSQQFGKLQRAYHKGRISSVGSHQQQSPKVIPDNLIGSPNEAQIILNDQTCTALLDTGSTVSTVSQSLFETLENVTLNPLQNIINIEGVTGHLLPYNGYIDVGLNIPMLGITNGQCLFLVVPDTQYTAQVPVIIGTNILTPIKDAVQQQGRRTPPGTSWTMAFQCLATKERQIRRNAGRLALIKHNSNSSRTIPCNKTIIVDGYIDNKRQSTISLKHNTAIVSNSDKSILPLGVEITPTLVNCDTVEERLQIGITNHNQIILSFFHLEPYYANYSIADRNTLYRN